MKGNEEKVKKKKKPPACAGRAVYACLMCVNWPKGFPITLWKPSGLE
jgi:hypothetical protein